MKLRVLALLMFGSAFALCAQVQISVPPTNSPVWKITNLAEQTNSVDPRDVSLVVLASEMNVFRLSAAHDINKTIEVWGGKEFQTKWGKEVMPLFPEEVDNTQLEDFFSSAIFSIGCAGRGKAVVGFYSPWSDGLLLLSVSAGEENPVLSDFQFVAGETWRGEKAQDAKDLLKLYAPKEPLIVSLARSYSAVMDKFSRLYPLDSAFVFLQDEVKKDVGLNADELVPIKMRMILRSAMFHKLFTKENILAVTNISELSQRIDAGDKLQLQSFLSPNQNQAMLENICAIPSLMRHNLAPNFFVGSVTNGECLVALVSPDTPRWVYAMNITSKDSTNRPAVSVEAMDLEMSKQIVQSYKSGGKK